MTTYDVSELRQRLASLPRLSLATLPTPLQEAPRLSEALGGPLILIKREDLTGMAMGGNKIREFEYSIAQAVEAKCDVLLHSAAAQSNQSRQTAAVAARLGLRSVIVGRQDSHAQLQGNLLLSHLFGAEINLPPMNEQGDTVKATMQRLRDEGCRPFNTSSDGADYRGIAYVDGFCELYDQLQSMDVTPDAIYVCSGAHTHTGLVVAARALGLPWRVVGVSPSQRDDEKAAKQHVELAERHARILDLDVEVTTKDLESYAEFVGEGYGIVTEGSQQALQVTAQTEGLLLDPCYSGKTMAGLMAHIDRGWWTKDHTIVFLHTGGTPALFAYADELGLETPALDGLD
ncbi:MAG TPA: pyridoxal-phosphate dependent enzyme [Candidatus Latescibacteria bacterium]|nr:pyridoxal-phosphate dependent enzyme [Candidatus Latescibacterota bacterium]MDP7633703.1 pyridoxal-phosphate dependent enzyme [Candidatus Latescibacterota bacterium]HJN27444.1 pyridoxal-phosphate dependent enzyme [Candidatus Latescibacterota bacterium]